MATPLSSALRKWNSLIPKLQAGGIDKKHYLSLAQTDITNVQQNKPGLGLTEIQDMINASIQGKAQVNPQAHADTGPLGVLGNALSDIGSAAFNFVPGVIDLGTKLSPISFHSGADIIQEPALVEDFRKVVTKDPETLHKYGLDDPSLNVLEYISKAPLGNLIPGIHTLADLSTDTGREDLLAHPGYAALDVLPYASEAGKLATVGREAEALSATEAYQAGNVAKGAARQAYDLLSEKTPLPLPAREAMRQVVERSPLSLQAKNLVSRPMVAAQSLLDRDWGRFMQSEWIDRMKNLSQDRREAVTRAAVHGAIDTLAPEERTAARAALATNKVVEQAGLAEGSLRVIPPLPGTPEVLGQEGFTYSAKSPVAKQKKALTRAEEAAVKAGDAYVKAATEHQQLLDRLQQRGGELTAADNRQIASGARAIDRAQAKLTSRQAAHQAASQRFVKTYKRNAPAIMHPVMDEYLRTHATAILQGSDKWREMSVTEQQLARQKIFETADMNVIKSYVGDKEFRLLRNDVDSLWMDANRLADAGVIGRPEYIPNVKLGLDNEFIRPRIGLKETRPRSYMDKTFNLSNSGLDLLIATEKNFADYMSSKATRQFVDEHLLPMMPTAAEAATSYEDMARNIRLGQRFFGYKDVEFHGQSISQMAENLMRHDYVDYNAEVHGFGNAINLARGQTRLLPKGVAESLKLMKGDEGKIPFLGKNSRVTKVFKFSVLVGPRHMAHIALGGLTMGLAMDPGFVTHFGDALRVLKGDENHWTDVLRQHVNQIDSGAVVDFSQGLTIGRLGAEVMKPLNAINRAEEFITNMYKISEALSAESKGFSHADALESASKMFVDVANMTAFESIWLRSVAPFYPFTKHLMRYMSTLAVDHPVRVSVLANLARIQEQHFGNALPGSWQNLFFLNSPDASGNQYGLDYRSVNPFRSMFNIFSLSGVYASLNPVFQAALQEAGINTLSVTPELYPALHVDPQTGQLVATHDPSSFLSNVFGSVVPETRAIDAYFGLSDNYKYLKNGDSSAAWRFMASALNMPFTISKYNTTTEMQKLEKARFVQAQKDVSKALSSKDFSALAGYNEVPVPKALSRIIGASYVTPAQLERLWEQLTKNAGGVDPRATMTSRR